MYQTDNTCVETAKQAVDYLASKQIGELVSIGNAQYAVSVVTTTSSSITYKFQNVNSNASITKLVPVTPLACTSLTVADAIQLSWLVVTCWVAAYAIRLIATSLQGHIFEVGNDS